jgi:hypothetical protein
MNLWCRLFHRWKYHTYFGPTCTETTVHAACEKCKKVYVRISRDCAPSDVFFQKTGIDYNSVATKFN